MYKRVLIPSDGTPGSIAAENAGIALAHSVGASVVGFVVASPPARPRFGLFPRDTARWSAERRAADRLAEDLLAQMQGRAERAGVPFSGRAVLSDRPGPEIVDAAVRNGCDLIYMGTRGLRGIRRLLGRSVAMEVVSLSSVPVTLCTRAISA